MASAHGPDLLPVCDVLGVLGGMSGERGHSGLIGAAFEFEAEHEAFDAGQGDIEQVRGAFSALAGHLVKLDELMKRTSQAYSNCLQSCERRAAQPSTPPHLKEV